MTLSDLAFILGAYLVGSVPHLYLLGLLYGKRLSGDLHHELWRQCGRAVWFLAVFLELARGVLTILIGRWLHLDIAVIVAGGLAVVAGQMWPIFHHFDGEKGNSVGVAMALALTPLPLLIALIPMLGGFLIRTIPRFLNKEQTMSEKLRFGGPPSNSFPLGMILGFAVLPLAAWLLGESLAVVLAYALLFALILLRRATAGLSEDIDKGKKLLPVIVTRLLYDRADL
ncbi:MAG: hypothetical protein C4542_08330 [Dehalococcoidia bacterium]|nr:MAG: hypothetical protein C4542_08330 [Dehalococcoidia bacterium]